MSENILDETGLSCAPERDFDRFDKERAAVGEIVSLEEYGLDTDSIEISSPLNNLLTCRMRK